MGHTINPISQRVSLSFYWNSNWSVFNKFNYVNLFKKDYILFKFLNWLIKKNKLSLKDQLVSHYKIYRINNNIYINWFYYDTTLIFDIFTPENMPFFYSNLKKKKYKYFRLIWIQYNKQRYLLFNIIHKSLYWNLILSNIIYYLKIIDNNVNNKYFFNIYKVHMDKFNAVGVSKFITIQLKKGIQLQFILKPILKDLKYRIKLKKITGYKILCSGRFTRKERKTKLFFYDGRIQKNYFKNFVQYNLSTVSLKYGMCGIKVWFNFGMNENLMPLKYNLHYPVISLWEFSIDKKYFNLNINLNFWYFMYMNISKKLNFKHYENYKHFLKIKIITLLLSHLNNNNKLNLKMFNDILILRENKLIQ